MKHFVYILILFISSKCYSQGYITVVVDSKLAQAILANHVVTMTALTPISNDYDEIKDYRNNIAFKTGILKEIKDKMYKSLFVVSEVVRSGKNVETTAKIISDIGKYQSQMVEYAKSNPALLLVAYKTESALITRSVELLTYIYQNALVGGDDNLISSKQRMQLIRYVIKELRVMRAIAFSVNRKMKIASKTGVLEQLTPYGMKYPNRDLDIINDILNDL